jgi:hypothetical protein
MAIGFVACNKDSTSPQYPQAALLAATGRSEEPTPYTAEEQAALNEHIEMIQAFKNDVIGWRTNPSGAILPAEEVIEKTEIVFNLNLGKPYVPFQTYKTSEYSVTVSSDVNWNTQTIVAFYGSIKTFMADALAGETNSLVTLSIESPNADHEVKVTIISGDTEINPSEIDHLDSESDIRWTNAPFGYTDPTPCGGSANDQIAGLANRLFAVYTGTNSGPVNTGNTPVPGKIVSRIVFGDHNLFGAQYPQSGGLQRVYSIATYGTPLESAHYNSVAFSAPPWNCLLFSSVRDFGTIGNPLLAANGRQYVPKVIYGPKNLGFNRRVVCTVALANIGQTVLVGGSVNILFQEHATRHFFGVVDYVVINIGLDEM